ncbi:ABC transporter substrate-binding protein [Rhodococcus qingshengii]|uniref:ABC transporter substrate-binding protein n=1 Tax=Rhodococcus qingshengii TaxID=334542 RepID=UPI0036D7876D
MRAIRRIAGTTAVGVAVALTTACGGGSEASDDGTITFGSISVLSSPVVAFPQTKTGIDAAVREINAEGGVNGRKLKAVVCNDQFDPNIAVNCAQKMVQEKVVAVVGGLTAQTSEFVPILEKAKIPVMASQGNGGELEFTSEAAYPLVSGPVGQIGGAGRYLVDNGGKNIVILRTTMPSGDFGVEAMTKGIEAGGGTVKTLKIADDATDYAPSAASALESKPDGIGLAVQGPNVPKAVSALRGLGYTGPIAMTLSFLNPTSIKSMGQDATGLVGVGDVLPVSNTDNPVVAKFIASLEAEDPTVVPDPASFKAYLGVKMLAGALDGMDAVSSEKLIERLDAFDGTIDFGGVIPNWTGIPNPATVEAYPRIAQVTSYPVVVGDDGILATAGEPFDPFGTK